MHPLIPESIRPLAAWVFLAGAVAFAVAVIYLAVRGVKNFRTRQGRYLAILDFVKAIGYLYPVGMLLKFSGFGPDFIRYWLGDFGFSVFIASLFVSLTMRYVNPVQLSDGYSLWLQDRRRYVVLNLKVLGVAVLLSLGYEVTTGVMNAIGPEGYSSLSFGIGTFDPIDVLMYFAGAGLAAWCWVYAYRLLGSELTRAAAREAAAKRAQHEAKALAKASSLSSPKYRKKKRVRHR